MSESVIGPLLQTVNWDDSLHVSDKLKKVRRNVLYQQHGIRQPVFDFLQKELLTTGNIQKMEGSIFNNTTMVQDVNISKVVYRSLLAKCTSSGAFKVCIWKYLHKTKKHEKGPSDFVQQFFDEPHALHVSNRVHATKIDSTITIKNKFRMQKSSWTDYQTLAARNTLNHFIRKYPRRTPMLCDLQHLQRNEKMLHQFIFSLFNEKADVSDEQLAEIACCRFNISLGELQHGVLNDFSDTTMDISDDELIDILLGDDFTIEFEEASVQQHAERTDDEEKTGEVKVERKIEVKEDTQESLKKEVQEWDTLQPTTPLTKHLLFRIAKFFMRMPRKKKDPDAVNKVAQLIYEEHGQDALFGLIDLYANDVDNLVVYRSNVWKQKWPNPQERRRNVTRRSKIKLADYRSFLQNVTIEVAADILEDGIHVPYQVYYHRHGRYAIQRYQRADAILDSDDLESREDYIQNEAKKVKAEVEIEQATTIPKNISIVHHICFRLVRFVLRMPRKPPNPVKMNELVESLYEEHGHDCIFVIDDWYAKHLKDFEVYESKAYIQTFTSRQQIKEKLVWMQKINWLRRIQDLKRGNEVPIDLSYLNDEGIPVDGTVRLSLRGRYCVCIHAKKKQMAVAESCVINMDTEFHEVQREVDEFEALDDFKINDYHYAVKLAFKTLKILMGVKREPPSPEHLKTFVKTQYTQYGTKAAFSIVDWHADCIENFSCYSSDEMCRRFGGGTDLLSHIQWSEKLSMRKMLRDIKYGKTVSWKLILLDTDGMQCHIQVECTKMGRYTLDLFREIKKHEPRPLQELQEVQAAAKTTASWIQILQTLGILAVVVCLIIIIMLLVQNSG